MTANGESMSFAEVVRNGDISRTFTAEELAAMRRGAALVGMLDPFDRACAQLAALLEAP